MTNCDRNISNGVSYMDIHIYWFRVHVCHQNDFCFSFIQIPHGVAFTSVQYQLSVNGTGGVKFSELRYIRFMEKGFTIYIQTDKAIYKPGQNGKKIKIVV